jgi:hypothetical protein
MKLAFWILVGVAVALAAGMIVPVFVAGPTRCKQPITCVNNLRQIDAAKEQWALENKKSEGDSIIEGEVILYIKGGRPTCPQKGVYRFGNVGEAPTCTFAGHSLN